MSKFEVRKHESSFSPLAEESRRVEGRAIVFETPSVDLGGFHEIIHRSAVTQELLDKSDVFARTNHSDDYIMARSNKGQGSLQLELREDGVYYSFDAPNTEKGEELLEHLRRNEISQSSFAFAVSKEKGSEKWEKKDGVVYRHIYKIGMLGDVAPVFTPAYEETSVCLRALNSAKELSYFGDFAPIEASFKDEPEEEKSMDKKPEQEDETKEAEKEKENSNGDNASVDTKPVNDDHAPEGEAPKEQENQEAVDTENQKPIADKKQEDDANPEDNDSPKDKHEEDKQESRTIINNENKVKMEKRFSILKAVNDIANNKQLDEISAAVVNAGANEMRSAGLSYGGQIQLPTEELRATIDVGTEGEDVVATEIFNVMEPLRAKNVLVQAGAKFITGLRGDVKVA